MYARASTIVGDPSRVDETVKMLETEILAQLEQVDGFQGIVALGDRTTGKSLVVTFWESEDAMKASEERANQLRSDAASRLGATGAPQVDRYEVLLQKVTATV
jgi:heme-degrading monooxygenase HmoA